MGPSPKIFNKAGPENVGPDGLYSVDREHLKIYDNGKKQKFKILSRERRGTGVPLT